MGKVKEILYEKWREQQSEDYCQGFDDGLSMAAEIAKEEHDLGKNSEEVCSRLSQIL